MNSYYLHDQLDNVRWDCFYKEQAAIDKQSEEAKRIDSLFPTDLSDFNPNDIIYSKYLNDGLAQLSYSDLINSIIEHNYKEIIK